MKNRKGVTLIELLIVMSILIIIAVLVMMTLDPWGLIGKARDAQRKKDVHRIKVALEEYSNDHERGCYPSTTTINQLNLASSCGSSIFSPWLSRWPCDPNGVPYQVVVEEIWPVQSNNCPKWFKVLTQLENESDKDVPDGWDKEAATPLGGSATSATANFGVSSTNKNWYDMVMDGECTAKGGCYYNPYPELPNVCNSAGTGCIGPNCFLGSCASKCRVSCCGAGCQ